MSKPDSRQLDRARDWMMVVDFGQRLGFPTDVDFANLRPDFVLWSAFVSLTSSSSHGLGRIQWGPMSARALGMLSLQLMLNNMAGEQRSGWWRLAADPL